METEFSKLPSIEKLVRDESLQTWEPQLARPVRVRVAQRLVSELRETLSQGGEITSEAGVVEELGRRYQRLVGGGIRRVINATGVVLHTNLGRAPLGREVLDQMAAALSGYSTLEFDPVTGLRGSRTKYVEALLELICGVEAAAVVNNCAAALLLSLHALARGKEVLVSRGELVQIGGGFRVPDILEASGARIKEVGTTNITTLDDYRCAVTDQTGLLLKVHQSNFVITGHTESASIAQLSQLAAEKGLGLVMDLGSGAIDPLPADLPETTVGRVIRDGASLVCFSGDKLLGGPQAGMIVGSRELISQLKMSPLYRALRLGKTELYLLEHTLQKRLRGETSTAEGLLNLSVVQLRAGCEALRQSLPAIEFEIIDESSAVGGGSLPETEIPTVCLLWRTPRAAEIARQLLRQNPPVVVRQDKRGLLLDLRTVSPEERGTLSQKLQEAHSVCS